MATWRGFIEDISEQENSAYKARSGREHGNGFSVGMQGIVRKVKGGTHWRGWQDSDQADILRTLDFVLWARNYIHGHLLYKCP